MIRELGEVTSVDGQRVTIKTQLKQGCGGCKQQSHCGAGLLSKAFPQRRGELDVWMEQAPEPGTQVELLLPEQAMVRFSVWLYLLPLLALFIGAWFGSALMYHEGWSILFATISFAGSFWVLNRWLRKRDVQVRALMQVKIIAPSNVDCLSVQK
ncbi:SoxR reducing system RseC family protein [Aliidiomarina sanyensis]|uniref:Fis family transcriptional regulator n=1 Tax=Aliidiomarina sanyensis TaxID=1249555 RepID=A0A432WRE9_9GAMM|nr:SoxR reducing system RseC family protein [Aliidiomarina sanyensis]RUO36341.1 Fis family transcriptional regulator [Aliidiomarina sanyensis]